MSKLWLSRSLMTGPYIALVTTQREFEKCLRDMKLTMDAGDEHCGVSEAAVVHTYVNDMNELVCIVGVKDYDFALRTGIEIAGLLTHEAVHVWQHWRSQIVYKLDASRTGGLEAEMEAYAIQNIFQTLMHAYAAKMG